ncbi:MAG: hypothetical protein IJG84_04590 [Kiritimatiellae bacterium]|nr:hypothetical protein [Kiritimatiellia bacterium]
MKLAACALLLCAASARGGAPAGVEMLPSEFDGKTPVVVETKAFRLVINPDATARSLVVKATGEECVYREASLPVFAATQKRPFNNETRLVQMAKRTTYPANRIRRSGDILRIGFDTAPYEAEVRVLERDGYAAFEIVRFISNTVQERQYYHWNMDVPPVEEFRLLQLPVLKRRNFGDWLNAEWDDRAAVAVMGGTPYMDVDHEPRGGWRLMRADSPSGIGRGIVTNGVAVLAAAAGRDALLGQIQAMEEDFDLPRGVESRRNPLLNASIYWTCDLSVDNVDEHIACMKKGGFRMMLVYSSGLFRNKRGYINYGDYDIDTGRFPNGYDDLRAVLSKIKAAGVTPGFHTLQTFIGFESRYVTPEADPRLNVKRYFALERPLSDSAGVCDVYVAQNPVDSPMHPKCRILKFGTELMSYEGYTVTPPYRFTGVRRGHLGTTVKKHGRGDGGGVLDVCECQATSCCIDQKTTLQDEIADKIAKVFDCGMEFLYFDGSEDVDVPCNVNISLSQYKVARRCGKMPLFTEGCAKTHFGWHLQSGANAFDIFPPEVFKEKIVEYPVAAAKRLAKDFTRVDFGWWGLYSFKDGSDGGKTTIGTQPDMWEYGTSKAAAFDCPATMQMLLADIRANARSDDLLETVRRWEDVRARKWLTPEQKEMLKDPNREFHLYKPFERFEKFERFERLGSLTPQAPQTPETIPPYELVEWKQLDVAGGKWSDVRAFMFERNGRRVVAYWHVRDRGRLVFAVPLDGVTSLDAAGMKYFETGLPAETVRAAFAVARTVPAHDPFGGAGWIWPAELGSPTNTVVEFLQSFTAPADGTAELTISADTVCRIALNGNVVVETCRFPDVPPERFYDVIPLSGVKKGENELLVSLYVQGARSYQHLPGWPGLVYSLAGSGFSAKSGVDAKWRVSSGDRADGVQRVTSQLGFSFEYDAAKAAAPWRELGVGDIRPAADEFSFRRRPVARVEVGDAVRERRVDQGRLEPTPVPPEASTGMNAARRHSVPPTDFYEADGRTVRGKFLEDGFFVTVDLGREEAGLLYLDIETDEGVVVDIGHAEHMEDGFVRADIDGRCFAGRYRAREGRQEFCRWARRMAGRYVQIQVRGAHRRFVLNRLTVRPAVAPVRELPLPKFSDPRKTEICRICTRTLRLCMHEHYEDCPWREQALYANDARNQMLAGYYAFDDSNRFPELALWLFSKGLREDGWLQMCMPARIPHTIPSFTFCWVMSVGDNLRFRRNPGFTATMMPTVGKILDRCVAEIEGGLLPCPRGQPYWQFYEWRDGLAGERRVKPGEIRFDAPLNLFFALALESGAACAAATGDAASAGKWRAAAATVRENVARRFWNQERREFATTLGREGERAAELTQSLALLAGCVPDGERERLARKLLGPSEWTPVTLSQSLYKYEALASMGGDLAAKGVEAMTAEWQKMVDAGATSFWEVDEGWRAFESAGSLCHGWSAIPLYIYCEYPEGGGK